MEEVKNEFEKDLEKELTKECKCCCDSKKCDCSKSKRNDAVYGLGLIGAAIYFISTATSFWIGVLGVLKAIVWPAILVYEALKFLA